MNYAYVTMLSTNDYLDGVLALYQGLKETKAKYPLVVCVTPNITQESIDILVKLKLEIIKIPQYDYVETLQKKYKLLNQEWLSNVSSKFYLFGLSQFDKIVSLDCDLLILDNIDDLFQYPHGSAVRVPPNGGISGGVVVLEPSEDFRDALMNLSTTFAINEEQSLNKYFPNWKAETERHIPIEYNVPIGCYSFIQKKQYKIIHFIGKTKPFIKTHITLFFHQEQYQKQFMDYVKKAKKELDARF